MATNRPSLSDAMQDRQARTNQDAVSNPDNQPPEAAGESLSAGRAPGKRRDPNYTLLAGLVPVDLKRRFKLHALQADREMADLLEEIISDWLDRNERR